MPQATVHARRTRKSEIANQTVQHSWKLPQSHRVPLIQSPVPSACGLPWKYDRKKRLLRMKGLKGEEGCNSLGRESRPMGPGLLPKLPSLRVRSRNLDSFRGDQPNGPTHTGVELVNVKASLVHLTVIRS